MEAFSKVSEVGQKAGDVKPAFDPDAKVGKEVSKSVGDAGKPFNPDAKVGKAEVSKSIGDSGKPYNPDEKVGKGEVSRTGGESKKSYDLDKKLDKDSQGDMRNCPIDGNNGHWDGERGNSTWIPDDNYVPEKSNPDGLTWREIKDKYGIEGIPFKDGEPDFSETTKGKVEIEGYSDSRPKNFAKADVEMANKRGCSPSEVREWREKNGYTWHESRDCKTMSKMPNDVHLNVPHRGGISTIKQGV